MVGVGHGEGWQHLMQQEKPNQSAKQGPGNKTTHTKALWNLACW